MHYQRNYIGYDYKEVVVGSKDFSQLLDGYLNFGWELDENKYHHRKEHGSMLYLKRDRKISNKAELTRLQRHYEATINQIHQLERSKTSKPTVVALTIGFLGTAFMAGSVFAITSEPPIIWLCILLAIPAFIGWALPYFVYSSLVRKQSEEINQLIEDKYDEIYEICEKGNHLLEWKVE